MIHRNNDSTSELFGQYMLVLLESSEAQLENISNNVDQAIKIYLAVVSVVGGIILVEVGNLLPAKKLTILIGLSFGLIGAIGLVSFRRILKYQMTSDVVIAKRNNLHFYFATHNPPVFSQYKGIYNVYFFKTSTWTRSLWDRPFLLGFGFVNCIVLAVGITASVASIFVNNKSYPLFANIWWLLSLCILQIAIFSYFGFQSFRRAFIWSSDLIKQIEHQNI